MSPEASRIPRTTAWIAATVLVVTCQPAASHGAPDPPPWMTRLLHDYNDDWGGHEATHDGHDLMALDLQEAYNATSRKDALVFRFLVDGGYNADDERPELRDVLTFTANGKTVTKQITTTDNLHFQGDFDSVRGPFPVLLADGSKDGTRFFIEGALADDALGVQQGSKIGNFFVQGYAGTSMADHMVGGYTLDGQRTDAEPASEQGQPVSYRRAEYTLRGPTMYAESSLDVASLAPRAGDNQTVSWTLTNRLEETQVFTLSAQKPSGVRVVLHGPYYSEDRIVVQVPPNAQITFHVYVTASTASPEGPVILAYSTDHGGHQEIALPFGGSSAGDASATGKSPAWPAVGDVAVLGIAALLLRRRGG